jgi:hypothetical protein
MRRINVRAILANPQQRRELMVTTIIATQAREGITTTRAQAEAAYDALPPRPTTEDTMTTTHNEPTTRTITLTDRAPVEIVDDHWPVIAESRAHDGMIAVQANRRWWMKVRQHADGRVIVYGAYLTQWQGEIDRRDGEVLDEIRKPVAATSRSSVLVATIRQVGQSLGAPSSMVRELIANLPAEPLT